MNGQILSDEYCLVFVAGVIIGLFYFGSLWLTVRLAQNLPYKTPLACISFVGRLTIVFVAFYIIMAGRWERLAAALLGFFLARVSIIRHIRTLLAAEARRGNVSRRR